MKLHPPIIEGAIPAFYASKLIVPFTMNKSVSENEIFGFALKIKTVQSNYLILSSPLTVGLNNWNKEKNEVSFIFPLETKLNIGQFYKIQMAYIYLDGTIGYYSTVGVVKYTSKPEVKIVSPNNGSNTYTGVYSQKRENENDYKDYSEKVYSYNFTLTDSLGNIIETSGDKIHNSSFDVNLFESIDTYTIKTDLKKDKTYYLDYTIKTVNGLIESASTKKIFNIASIDSKLKTRIQCILNYENGYIDINLTKPEDIEIEESAVGSFYLLRASDEDNFNSWHEVLKFVLYGQQPSRHLWKDMTIKQGVRYKYAIQQFNIYGLRSNKIESDVIYADFEHAFLYDGERQLKIKYNPKLSSFKNTLLESKIDTIGSKHPFIFRNGNVNYKEFPISGLISYLSDENNLFYNSFYYNDSTQHRLETINKKIDVVKDGPIYKTTYNKNKTDYFYKDGKKLIPWTIYIQKTYPDKNINSWDDMESLINEAFINELLYYEKKYDNIEISSTHLTSNNIFIERNFKLEVLEWLTNGKPKLFRSPTEGNYIVRLMNVSLTPTDALGRMLHTFSSTAYEVSENNYENLEKYNFIKVNNTTEPQLRWLSVDLSKNKIKNNTNLLKFQAESIYLEGLLPGDKLQITTVENDKENNYSIMIGATGKYIIDLNNNVKIKDLHFKDNSGNNAEVLRQGMLTYAYYSTDFKDSFDTVYKIENQMVPCQQFIGEHENIIAEIENVKDKIDAIGFIKFTLRNDDIEVYRFNNKYYSDKQATDEIDLVDLTNIYKVNILDKNKNIIDFEWFDGYNNISLGKECKENDTKIIINNSEEKSIDIKDTAYYELHSPSDVISIRIGAAIIAEICYSKKVIQYDLEYENSLILAKKPYEDNVKTLKNAIENKSTSRTKLKECQDNCKESYREYVKILNLAITEAERR